MACLDKRAKKQNKLARRTTLILNNIYTIFSPRSRRDDERGPAQRETMFFALCGTLCPLPTAINAAGKYQDSASKKLADNDNAQQRTATTTTTTTLSADILDRVIYRAYEIGILTTPINL